MFKFDLFDSFLDGVLFVDATGLIVYSNQTASVLLNLSVNRLVNKKKIYEVLTLKPAIENWTKLDFSEQQISNEFYQEFEFETPQGITGSINLVSKIVKTEEQTYQMIVMRDISLEKTLHVKYQHELREKNLALEREIYHSKTLENLNDQLDRRIFHIECLFDFSQKTRLLSDSNHLVNEFIEFIVAKFHFDCGFVLLKNPESSELDIQFINGIQGRKAIYSKMDLILAQLPNLKITDFPSKHQLDSNLSKSWIDFLSTMNIQNQSHVLRMNFRINKTHQAAAVFSLGNGKRPPDEHDLSLIQSLIDQTEVMIENTELKFLSLTDEMTKLYNLRYLNISLTHEIQKSLQSEFPLSLLIFDIDHFKKFNDNYGHLVGDKVIRAVAQKVKSLCRLTDIPFRYGGEEFILLLPNTSIKNAMIVAERVRKGVESLQVEHNNEILRITISVGVSACPVYAKDGESLIHTADEALYKAKNDGRNNCKLYTI